jgi:hypothetical protein
MKEPVLAPVAGRGKARAEDRANGRELVVGKEAARARAVGLVEGKETGVVVDPETNRYKFRRVIKDITIMISYRPFQ